jgi:hypothetical protein
MAGMPVANSNPAMPTFVHVGALLLLALAARPARAQELAGALEARVWLDRGEEPVLRPGEDVRVFYRTSEDAFAAIFRIDTDGRVHLIYPQHPDAIEVVRGGRDYRLLFPHAPTWRVSEDPGAGYLFMVASSEPLDFSTFPYDDYHGWDLGAVGDVVYSDPYVAIDDYVARIIPNWEQVPYALDFLTYSVGEVAYSYPRFLCYDCHTYQRYASWNPYDYTCSTFRVVIWDDPYFYPRYRYSGVNVVVAARPVRASLPRYEVTRRVLGDAVAPVVRTRAATARRPVEYKETPTAAAAVSNARSRTSALAAPAPAARVQTQERPRAAPQEAPDSGRARPTLQRRPSSRLPVRTPPSAQPQQPEPTPTPVMPSRAPSDRPSAAPARPSDPPSASSRAPTPSYRPSNGPATNREPQRAPTPRTSPSNGRESTSPSAAPSRPQVRAVPAPGRPSAAPSRPQATPRPQAAPRSQAAPSRPSASSRPSAGSSGGASARPSASPPARAAAPPRSGDQRPTVRARPADPR